MSPTIFREGAYRFYFFSREELRMHVHVAGPNGEAKIWLEPEISVADVYGFNQPEINQIVKMVKEHEHDISEQWRGHFRR